LLRDLTGRSTRTHKVFAPSGRARFCAPVISDVNAHSNAPFSEVEDCIP
jgi:hypothetical protein